MHKVFYLFIILPLTFSHIQAQSWQACYDSSMYYYKNAWYKKANSWAEKAKMATGNDQEKTLRSLNLLIDINLQLNNQKTAISYISEMASELKPLKKKKPEYFNALLDLSDTYSSNDQISQADSILNIAVNYTSKNYEKTDIKERRVELYMDAGRWEEADSLIDKENIRNLNLLVRKYIHEGDYEHAEDEIASLLKYYKKGTENYEKIYMIYLPSILALSNSEEIYEFNSPEFHLDSVFSTSEKIFKKVYGDKSKEYFEMLLGMGNKYEEAGIIEKADSLYRIVYKISSENFGKYNSLAADALISLGNRYEESGQLIKAQNILDQVDILGKEVFGEESGAYGECLLLLLYFDIHVGRYEEGLKKYQKIYPIYVKEYGKQSSSYSSLVSVYSVIVKQQSDYTQAASLVKEAIDITEKNGVDCNPCYGNLLISLARIQEEARQYKEAEETYFNALAFLEKNLNGPWSNPYYLDFRTYLADFYAHCNALKVQDQLKYYPGDTIVPKDGMNYVVSKSSDPKAFSDTDIHNLYKEAIRFYSDKYSSKHPRVADLKIRKAIFSWVCDERYKASREFREGLDEYLEQIHIYFPQMSEKEKTEFYNNLSDYFNAYYSFVLKGNEITSYIYPKDFSFYKNLMGADTVSYSFTPTTYRNKPMIKIQDHYKANMFNYRLPTKAIIFNSSNQIKKRILTSGDSSLIKEYKKWEEIKILLANLYTTGGEERVKYQYKIDSIEASLNQLERNLSERSEHFRNKQEKKEYTWQDIQKKLKKDEAAVEIVRLNHPLYYQTKHSAYKDSVYYAVAIITSETIDNPTVFIIRGGNEIEKNFFNYYRNCIKYKIEDKKSYGRFWGQIEQGLYGKKTIYVSTDGVYNLINLSTLKNSYGSFLLESKDIRIVTNLKDLLQPIDTIYKNKNAVLFGDPDFKNHKNRSNGKSNDVHERSIELENLLRGGIEELPGTKQETEKIYKLLSGKGWEANLLQKSLATEDTLKSVNNIRLLHLATHGFFISNPGNPKENPLLHSGLLFAGGTQSNLDNSEDGILTAYEAMNLDLENTELVVLSACETGLGEVKNGEGVYGLQRAFRISGAQTMIMSLWKINDAATSEFMGLFYEYWMKTGDKRKAFRDAQMQIKIKYKDPYYWGAFTIIGF